MTSEGLLAAAVLVVACHNAAAQKKSVGVDRVVQDSARVAAFRDTAGNAFAPPGAREFDLRRPAQRDSLRATLRRERALWQAKTPKAYRFLLRTSCFCPGQRGWLLIEVRKDQPLRAWDRTGKEVALTDWDTYSIDQLFDRLRQSADRQALLLMAVDPRRHFPTFVRTTTLPGPDMWSVVEVRGLRPL